VPLRVLRGEKQNQPKRNRIPQPFTTNSSQANAGQRIVLFPAIRDGLNIILLFITQGFIRYAHFAMGYK